MVPSTNELLEIAKTYWPSHEDPNQEPSPEAHVLHSPELHWRHHDVSRWMLLVRHLPKAFS